MKPHHFVIIACAGFVAMAALLLGVMAPWSLKSFFWGISAGTLFIIPLLILIAVVRTSEEPKANYDQRAVSVSYDQRAVIVTGRDNESPITTTTAISRIKR